MATITLASVIIAAYSVWDSKLRYIDSILPIISFKLSIDKYYMYLEILNTGKSPARKLTIRIIEITDSNQHENMYHSEVDYLSDVTFDLFPDEIVCNHIFRTYYNLRSPLVKLQVSYSDDWGNTVAENRTVFIFNNRTLF